LPILNFWREAAGLENFSEINYYKIDIIYTRTKIMSENPEQLEKLEKSEGILENELLVTPEGAFTFVHEYRQPSTGRVIKLVGMTHNAEQEYLNKVSNILDECDLVIYEGPSTPPPNKESTADEMNESDKEIGEKLFSNNLDESFRFALPALEIEIRKNLPLINERYHFDDTQPSWISGDAEWFAQHQDPAKQKEFEHTLLQEISQFPQESKLAIVMHIRNKVRDIRQRGLTPKDTQEFFELAAEQTASMRPTLDRIMKSRHEILERTLCQVIKERNPHTLGIKFGAYHIGYLRPQLEAQGYVLQNTIPLKAVSFGSE